MRADQLAATFGIANVLAFSESPDGLVKADIAIDGATAEVFPQGACVARWAPAGARPVLFTSPNSAFAPGRAIRGGVPIIFPWFGPHRTQSAAPQHGFVRAAPWQLDAVERGPAGEVILTFSCASEAGQNQFWPEKSRLTYRVSVGRQLALELAVENLTTHEIVFEEALHTYFAISDIDRVSVSGLEGCTFIDKTDGLKRKQQAGAVTLAAEMDRVYLATPARAIVHDPDWQRRIVIDKAAAASSIVWNPWAEKSRGMADLGETAWRGMICVETGNVADNEVHLAAGATHRMTTAITLGTA